IVHLHVKTNLVVAHVHIHEIGELQLGLLEPAHSLRCETPNKSLDSYKHETHLVFDSHGHETPPSLFGAHSDAYLHALVVSMTQSDTHASTPSSIVVLDGFRLIVAALSSLIAWTLL
ncbi:hypothetical protein KI387_028650, partial [Taxus chinensis]